MPLWPMAVASVVGLVLGSCFVLASGRNATTALVVCAAVGLVMGAVLEREARRRRGVRVDLHADGVVAMTAAGRDAIVFEDVDTLWLELNVRSSGFSRKRADLLAIRLVDHDGGSHRVPMGVRDGMVAAQWILRRCSDVLLDDAREALRNGEAMTFAEVVLDREGVTFGNSARVAWDDLRLVRLQPGSISFFRQQPIIPWRTVRLDRVPHPTVFGTLVRELAARVEVDDPASARARRS